MSRPLKRLAFVCLLVAPFSGRAQEVNHVLEAAASALGFLAVIVVQVGLLLQHLASPGVRSMWALRVLSLAIPFLGIDAEGIWGPACILLGLAGFAASFIPHTPS